ncbi:conserved hypothetical protein [Ricinus communis]|uniref:F-box domain-containing protein n=1 Tax=Ricinus communis TaxID=3988 RepID=B9RUN2_RICCO|nr:conserved hypothetical protein [Ricinus communis]
MTATTTKLTDLNEDSLAHCANYLSLQDLSNLAITCKCLKRVAYSDSIWHRCYRERWPLEVPGGLLSLREAYSERLASLHQFKCTDPLCADLYTNDSKPFDHVMLDNNDIIFSQGSSVQIVKIDSFLNGIDSEATTILTDHNARITYKLLGDSSSKVLASGGEDGTVRIWSLNSIGKRGQHTLKATFYGHGKPIKLMSVAGYVLASSYSC